MTTADAARWSTVTNGERGRAIERRAVAMGIDSGYAFERMSGEVDRRVTRASYGKAIKGEVSDATFGKIEDALRRMEERTGHDAPDPQEPHLIRIKVEGVYGAKALIVEGSPDDQAQLEAMVDRIMRNLRAADVPDE